VNELGLPYEVLIIDDAIGLGSFGEINKILLEENEFRVTHVTSIEEARTAISGKAFDIMVIDLDLQSRINGLGLHTELRRAGHMQPIVLTTAVESYLNEPISTYAVALAVGPLQFFNKRGTVQFLDVMRDASHRVDPIRRVLRLMKEAGLGDTCFPVKEDGNVRKYKVDELLESTKTTDDLVRALREALYELTLEWQAEVFKKNEDSSYRPSRT